MCNVLYNSCNLLFFPGLTSIAKVILAMENNMLPGNLHYQSPNVEIPGLADGRLSVIAENTPWNGGYVGINSFGFGGSNAHVILKSRARDINKTSHPDADRMRLFTASGRTKEVTC